MVQASGGGSAKAEGGQGREIRPGRLGLGRRPAYVRCGIHVRRRAIWLLRGRDGSFLVSCERGILASGSGSRWWLVPLTAEVPPRDRAVLLAGPAAAGRTRAGGGSSGRPGRGL